jgi:GDP-L-fucose synthase
VSTVPSRSSGEHAGLAPVPLGARVFVAGRGGLVGSAVWRALEARGYSKLVGPRSSELDLRDEAAVEQFFSANKPEYVFLAAARVGGILANDTYPAEFLSDNLRIQLNVMDAAQRHGVKRLLFLGSSCIYPKFAPQPIREESLLTGALEPTNDAYAVAKIAGIYQVRSLRKQHGVSFISAMPTNLYGPGDNFDLKGSHVLPALLRKVHEAKERGSREVEVWGTGSPRREFLFVDDLADACLFLMERYDSPEPINVGVGEDLSIRELAELIARVVGYEGEFVFDSSKPDGTPRKLLDVSRLRELGWEPKVSLEEGIERTYQWYQQNIAVQQQPLAATR